MLKYENVNGWIIMNDSSVDEIKTFSYDVHKCYTLFGKLILYDMTL